MEQEEKRDIFVLPREDWASALILQEFSLALQNYKRYAVTKDPKALVGLKYSLRTLRILLKPIKKDIDLQITIGSDLNSLEEALEKFSEILHDLGITKIERERKEPKEEYEKSIEELYEV